MEVKKYEEIGSNYRFFLGWRHAAFAGILVVLFGVLSLTFTIYKETPSLAFVIPFIASPIGILLYFIDKRTRDLYHAAIRAGKFLEGGGGFYTELSKDLVPKGKSPFIKITQSAALDLLFIGSSLALIALSLYLRLTPHP